MKQKTAELSVVIASRAEQHLEATIRSARETAGARIEVVVVFDGGTEQEAEACTADHCVVFKAPRGIGAARHAGIQRAAAPVVVITDAHMVFQPGWAAAFLAHLKQKAHARDLVCGQMRSMSQYGVIEDGSVYYSGAKIYTRSRTQNGECLILTAAWHRQPAGPIGAVMGALYGFRRQWYLDMGEPLAPLLGWGMDEEMLSIGSWICGGRVVLLNVWAAHLMKTSANMNYTPEPDHNRRIWLNRFRMAELVPCSPEFREGLRIWLTLNVWAHEERFIRELAEDLERPEVQRIRQRWADKAPAWEAYLAQWVSAEPRLEGPAPAGRVLDPVEQIERAGSSAPVEQVAPVPRAQVVPAVQCPNCRALNSARWYSTKTDQVGTVRRHGRCNVVECGLPVVCIERHGAKRYLWGVDSAFAD